VKTEISCWTVTFATNSWQLLSLGRIKKISRLGLTQPMSFGKINSRETIRTPTLSQMRLGLKLMRWRAKNKQTDSVEECTTWMLSLICKKAIVASHTPTTAITIHLVSFPLPHPSHHRKRLSRRNVGTRRSVITQLVQFSLEPNSLTSLSQRRQSRKTRRKPQPPS
jgi:hypothetical protein